MLRRPLNIYIVRYSTVLDIDRSLSLSLMKVSLTNHFLKKYKKLPKNLQKKVDRQITFLEVNFFHPSLNSKRLKGHSDWWEFRVTKNYRMSGRKLNGKIILHALGPHDEGLGKK